MPLFFLLDYLRTVMLGMPSPLRIRYAVLYVAITVGITYAIAWLSYNAFEKRFLDRKSRFAPVYENPRMLAHLAERSG
jgi:peptidoglycan/LPS O-acetylase OafA/YrhL